MRVICRRRTGHHRRLWHIYRSAVKVRCEVLGVVWYRDAVLQEIIEVVRALNSMYSPESGYEFAVGDTNQEGFGL